MVLPALLAACDDDDETRRFTVAVEAISVPQTIDSTRVMGTVPLSAGAWVVYRGDVDPAFEPGALADTGTELIAEDGVPSAELAPTAVGSATKVEIYDDAQSSIAFGDEPALIVEFGEFAAPGGADNGPAIFPALDGFAAEVATFTFDAEPGDRLQLQTMFVQSNDWFYGFQGGGLELFPVDDFGISGDVTDQLALYDAGTEVDTPPGTGPDQVLAHPNMLDVGALEAVPIELAELRHPQFAIPVPSEVIRVTISVTGVSDDDDEI